MQADDTNESIENLCERMLNEYADKDKIMPDYFYEYLNNRIGNKGYDLSNLLCLLLSDKPYEIAKENKSDPRYKNIAEFYNGMLFSSIYEIKDIDKETDIYKLDRRNKCVL